MRFRSIFLRLVFLRWYDIPSGSVHFSGTHPRVVQYSFKFGVYLQYTPTNVYRYTSPVKRTRMKYGIPSSSIHLSGVHPQVVRYSFGFGTPLRYTPSTVFLQVRCTSPVYNHGWYSSPSGSVYFSGTHPRVVRHSFGLVTPLRYTPTGGMTFLRVRYISSVYIHETICKTLPRLETQ